MPVLNDPRPEDVLPGSRPGAGRLLQVLGVAFGIAVLVGNSIATGILRTPGEVAAHVPKAPLYMGVWILGALFALLGALTLAELGAMYPFSGGQYPIVKAVLGPYPGFICGWSDWLSTCGSAAGAGIVMGEYIGPLIPPLAGHESITGSAVVAGFALLQWRGIRIGDLTQQITSVIKALALLALAGAAFVVTVEPQASASVAAAPALPSGIALFAAVIVAGQSAIVTYDGWTGPIYFSEELRDPAREIPRSMIGGVLLVLAIYLALNAAFLHVIPIGQMAGDPFVAATVASRLFGPSGDWILRIVMVLSLAAAISAFLLMASRIPFAMGRDGFLPAFFCRVNPGGTPVLALMLSLLVTVGFIVSNTFGTVIALLAFMFVTNYALSFSSLFVSRYNNPDAVRPFRVPAYPLVPGLALGGAIAFMVSAALSDQANSAKAIALVAISWPIYRLIPTRQTTRKNGEES